MFDFLYNDPRYKAASGMSQKTRTALDIILEFISTKLLDFIGLLFLIAIVYFIAVIFYSNMVLFLNIALKSAGLIQIGYGILGVAFGFVFCLFGLLIAVFILSSFLSLFTSGTALPGAGFIKIPEKVKQQKLYFYLDNFYRNATSVLRWDPKGGWTRKWLLLLLSIIAFYHSWFTIPSSNLRVLKYNFMPDFFMKTSKGLYQTTKVYANSAYGSVEDFSSFLYKFVDANIISQIPLTF